MRTILLYILVFSVIASCKDASYDNIMAAPEMENNTSFSKEDFYISYIKDEFNNQLELNHLKETLPSDYTGELIDVEVEIPANLVLQSFDLDAASIDNTSAYYNPDYDYYYKYEQVFVDTLNQREVRFSGFISINEENKVIDQDTLNTVKIIWQ